MGVGSSLGIIASWRFFSLLSISFVSWTTLDQNSSSTFLIKSSSCLSALSLKYHHYNQHSHLLFPSSLFTYPPPPPPPTAALCCLAFSFSSRRRPSSIFSRLVSRSNIYQPHTEIRRMFQQLLRPPTMLTFCFSFGCRTLRVSESSRRVILPECDPVATSLPRSCILTECRESSHTCVLALGTPPSCKRMLQS